jgi:hypothetical protein
VPAAVKGIPRHGLPLRRRLLPALVLAACMGSACAALPGDGTAALAARHQALLGALQHNAYGQALVIESSQTDSTLQGDIYAEVDVGFAELSQALGSPAHWCDILILHINTKGCRQLQRSSASVLQLYVGRKTPQDLASSSRLEFVFRPLATDPAWLAVNLAAPSGPLGTHDYRISLEAIPLGETASFFHLRYAYGYGLSGRLALQTYLATLGRDKRGFTPEADGVRGLVERNTMRYYLAIVAYLQSTRASPAQQLEARLRNWFDAVERYPAQLHEMDWPSYVEMKRAEVSAMRKPGAAVAPD